MSSPAESSPCPGCSGAGAIVARVEFDDEAPTDMRLTCTWCGGTGALSEEQRRQYDWAQLIWCRCEASLRAGLVAHGNSETPWKNCVEKHHYHCGSCRGVSQIG